MLRLVVVHQLVLSLLVGPMLCCCTTARLGHDAGSAGGPPRKSCCGSHDQKESTGGDHAPGGEKPVEPAKCPCKDAPAVVAAVPEAKLGTSGLLSLLTLVNSLIDLPASVDAAVGAARCAPRFDHCTSCPSTAQLLYAHHNLRC